MRSPNALVLQYSRGIPKELVCEMALASLVPENLFATAAIAVISLFVANKRTSHDDDVPNTSKSKKIRH